MIERATVQHAERLALTMRSSTRLALLASCGLGPRQGLDASIGVSTVAYAMLAGDEVLAIFGVRDRDVATPRLWMLTGDAVDQHKLTFFRESRRCLRILAEHYGALECQIDARDEQLLGFVKALGFDVQPARPFGLARLPFHRIEVRAHV